ncbi:MAG: 3-hydroxybutyrate dehydrogenase [Aquisalimonadaceae bacterium]
MRRNAVITGSTSGIGLAIAEAMAGEGMNITLNGFGDRDNIEQLRGRIASDHGVQVIYSAADVSKPDQIKGMLSESEHAFGQVDVLVNNAGIQHVASIEEFPPEKWDAILAINLTAAFHTTRQVIGGMKQRGWGRMINIASAHALVGSPNKSAYIAAKHGLIGLTRTVALEAATSGVTANAICPGYVRTALVEQQIQELAKTEGITEEEAARDIVLEPQPIRRFVETEEVAALAVFLCSDTAAAVTGAALPVDGGWTAQ